MNNVFDHPSVNLTVKTLLDERHTAKDRTSSQPSGTGQWLGPFRGMRRGQGTEFDDLRHYSLGDDARHIDWKASARTNVVHTRLYREEREYRTTFIVDLRDALFTGTKELQAVRICRLAAKLLWQANDCGSKTQILVVTDDGLGLTEASSGHASAIDACTVMAQLFESRQSRLRTDSQRKSSAKDSSKQLDSHTSVSTTSFNATDTFLPLPKQSVSAHYETVQLDQVTEWLLQQKGKHATTFWISAFDHCGEQFDSHIRLLSKNSCQVAIIADDDVMENGLPTGRYPYKALNNESNPNDSQKISLHRIATLDRTAKKKLNTTLKDIKKDRENRFNELMMPSFYLNNDKIQLVASLRQYGYLP